MLEQIITIVRQAGDIIRNAHDIENASREKTDAANLVTEYDEAVQAFLQRELLTLLPEADFFGEEGQHDALTKDWTFVVDPIDGTTNFVRSLHQSNISVALAYCGETRYAVVYDPFHEELFAAEKGAGATCNGSPIRVSRRDVAHALCGFGSTPYDRSYTDRTFAIMRKLHESTLDFRRFGSAALDICQVAAGRMEIFFECRLAPWDFAAGSLILTEAGGCISRLDGSAAHVLKSGSIWATNALCFDFRETLS